MASALIGALRIVLGMDSAAFEEGLSLAEKRLNGFGKRMNKLGGQLQTWGAGLSLAVTAPVVAIGKGMLDAASDAAESASAFDFLFKDQAKSVRSWADTMAAEIGRSTYALQDQALAFQQYFSQVAPTNEKAAELSKTFTLLAQDLASFYNVTESDALEKLRSGLSGEAEPLRTFGVFLNEAAVKAKGLEMGLGGANGELSEQEKVLARAAVIMEQTAAAQGDAARTSGSFANQQKALSAAISDLGIKLGTILLPMAQRLVVALTGLVQWFGALSPATQEWIVIAAGIAATLGPALVALGLMASGVSTLISALPLLGAAFTLLTGPIGLAVAAIGSVAAAWVYWDELKAAFPGVVSVVEAGVSAIKLAFDTVVQSAAAIGEALVRMKDIAIAAVTALVTGVQQWMVDKLNAIFDSVGQKIQWVSDKFFGLYDAVVGHSFIPDMVTGIGDWMAKLDGLMVHPATAAATGVSGAFEGVGSSVDGMFSGFGSSIAAAIKGTKSWSDVFSDVLSKISELALSAIFGGGGGGLGGFFSSLVGGLFGFASGGSIMPGGTGGIDSQLVAFRKSPNERVDITKPGQSLGGGATAITVNVEGARGDQHIIQLVQQGVQAGISQAAPEIVRSSVGAVQKTMRDRPGYAR